MNQKSRQALIELLFLALYLDDHLSLAEDEELVGALESLGWDSPQTRERFLFSAFSAARQASTDPAQTEEFVRTRAELLKNDNEQGVALTWLSRILAADGLSSSEKFFLHRLEAHLYP